MNVSTASEKIYESETEREIANADDDPIADLIERCFGVRGVQLENYLEIAPVLGGWSRDVTGNTAAPVVLAAIMLAMTMLLVGVFRLLQKVWAIEMPPVQTDADSSEKKA